MPLLNNIKDLCSFDAKYAVLFVILNFIVDMLSCSCPKIPKKGNAGLKWNRQQVDKMKT